MLTFAYVVKDKTGRTHSGSLETDSKQSLIEQLWKQELVVLSIEERHARPGSWTIGQPSIPAQQLVIFSRQLATLVASGIPIVSALGILGEQMEHRAFRRVLRKILEQVQAGTTLSDAMAKHPNVFSDLYLNMVKAGESSGKLDEILDRLAGYLEKIDVLRRKVSSSLFYPALVSLLAFAITAFLVIVVVPKFRDIFTSLGGQLPLPTQILLMVSDALRHYFVLGIILGIGIGLGFKLYVKTAIGRRWFDHFKLNLPLVGSLLKKVAIARFARTLATLTRSGVPILSAMDIVAKTAGNKVIEEVVLRARTSIKEGENIADPLAQGKVFPPMVTRMISVGEKTGELEQMLSKISEFYENEVDTAVAGLTSLIEPLIIAFLGVVIGGVVIALFLPVFKLSQLVSP